MSDITEAFASDDPALVPYVTAGDPEPDATAEYVEALAAGGADVIELGMPFSEPIADGPTIQNAIQRALAAGTTPERYFEIVESLDVDVPLVCMTYYNLLYQYGESDPGASDYERLRPFVQRAAEAGISGLIIPDLPVDESDPLREACDEFGVDLIFIVAPTTTEERLAKMRERVSGFVYVQARLGTTGAKADVSDATHESLARVADWSVPKAVGFGVSEREHAAEIVEAGADGVVAGSVFVDIVAEGDTAESTAAERLAAKAAELKAGAIDGATGRIAEQD
jgi:tryptophan synthase alpha chain